MTAGKEEGLFALASVSKWQKNATWSWRSITDPGIGPIASHSKWYRFRKSEYSGMKDRTAKESFTDKRVTIIRL